MQDHLINILYVEDDEIETFWVKRSFEIMKIANPLFIATNGAQALDLLRGTNGTKRMESLPGVILLDLYMPIINGIEFLKILRADPILRILNVFVVSINHEDKELVESHGLHVSNYLQKSINVKRLMPAIAALNSSWILCDDLSVVQKN